ncbi:MAG: hypothetical protein K2X61_08890 [Caulobacteraceae bacterium]|nr:hypothetical protein [Caulobacteraceae bacterium]
MTPLHQTAYSLALRIEAAEIAYDENVRACQVIRRGHIGKAARLRLARLDDEGERQADALRAMRTELERLQDRIDREAACAARQAEADRQGVLL